MQVDELLKLLSRRKANWHGLYSFTEQEKQDIQRCLEIYAKAEKATKAFDQANEIHEAAEGIVRQLDHDGYAWRG